jgi:AraC-like DNA-binding protein
MEHYVFLFVNTALVMGCLAMAVVFLVLPLPPNKGLTKYRISLRFLSGAFLTLGILKILVMVFDLDVVNLIGIETLTIASVQASLFTFSLITLINPVFITKRYLYRQLIPVPVFVFLYIIVAVNWGNPQIQNFQEFKQFALHPAILIRELFLIYYAFQLLYLFRLFRNQTRIYSIELNNYFADTATLHLLWVKYCFYAAFVVGIFALLSCFILTVQLLLLFTISYAIFYMVFGICYIQYPSTFIYIEPSIFPTEINTQETSKTNKRLVWSELKMNILTDRYYLKTGVNIEDMARYLKIGRTTLSTFINTEEGMNFNAWINLLRIEEAKEMFLKYPDSNLIEISEMVGYSESSNFSRQFKVITKESPSFWRQTHLS